MRGLLLAPVFGVIAIGIPIFLIMGGLGSTPAPLERTTWNVTIEPDPLGRAVGMKSFDDVLEFRKKRVGLRKQQLVKPSPYEAAQSATGWVFTAPEGSALGEPAIWSGEVIDDTISGVMTRTQPSGTTIRFAFRGRRQSDFER